MDEEISIGDFVLTGGELAAWWWLTRWPGWCPGCSPTQVLRGEESHWNGLLEYPQYSRPEGGTAGRSPPFSAPAITRTSPVGASSPSSAPASAPGSLRQTGSFLKEDQKLLRELDEEAPILTQSFVYRFPLYFSARPVLQ